MIKAEVSIDIFAKKTVAYGWETVGGNNTKTGGKENEEDYRTSSCNADGPIFGCLWQHCRPG